MDKETYKKLFDFLFQDCVRAHYYFHTWKVLKEESYDSFYKRWHYLWGAIFESLQANWLRNLANIYEESKYSKKDTAISVFTLLKHQTDSVRATEARQILESNSDLIKRIKNYRDKLLSHNDIAHILDPKLEVIKYAEIEELTKISGKILSLLNPEEGHGYSFINFEDGPKRDAEAMFEGLRYYKQKCDRWMEKFSNGEVNSHKMPDDF